MTSRNILHSSQDDGDEIIRRLMMHHIIVLSRVFEELNNRAVTNANSIEYRLTRSMISTKRNNAEGLILLSF